MSEETGIQNKERSELHTEAHRLQNIKDIYRQRIETYHEKIKSTFTSRQFLIPANIILTKIDLTIELNWRNNEFVYMCDRLTKEKMVHCLFSTHFFANLTVLMTRKNFCTDVEKISLS
jgi:hypothetical protein